MIQKIKILALQLVAVAILAAPMAVPATVGAQNLGQKAACGANLQVDPNCTPAQNPNADANRLNSTIQLIVNLFSVIVGIVAVIMIIIGGLKYIISSGDASNITSAKNTILYAIIGLVIVALAQFIVRFVLSKVG